MIIVTRFEANNEILSLPNFRETGITLHPTMEKYVQKRRFCMSEVVAHNTTDSILNAGCTIVGLHVTTQKSVTNTSLKITKFFRTGVVAILQQLHRANLKGSSILYFQSFLMCSSIIQVN
jgi:hypothetical protein